MMKKITTTFLPLLALLLALNLAVFAQKKGKEKIAAPVGVSFDENLYNALEYRLIGPFRGGRSCAVTGVPGKPNL